MLIELKPGTPLEEQNKLIARLQKMGFQIKQSAQGKLAAIKGIDSLVQTKEFEHLPHVQKVHSLKTRFILASRHYRIEDTVINIKDVDIGGGSLFVVGGPCSIESEKQMQACAKAAKETGAKGLRGGAFKPRTSPYEFQGMQEEGLKLLQKAGQDHDLITVSEVMEISQIPLFVKYVDILQVGARNMQNFNLLRELGKLNKPILLKRGFSATYQDFLMAAEYILSEGNPNVILCERGIRTFEIHTRNTLDLNAVPVLRELSHLPIMVDPSHGTGIRSLVAPMAKASLAAGADGLMIEMHPHPDQAVSDAQQTITLESFAQLMKELNLIHTTLRQFK
jgi:3-deoxy-7-phosphoheptulonate synthase